MIDREWLSVSDLCRWLRLGRNKTYELVQTGQIPSYRLGRSIRVRRQDVEEWIEGQRYGKPK